jgi:hypothetical protein
MKKSPGSVIPSVSPQLCIAAIILACSLGLLKAADRKPLPVNQYGAPVIDAQGCRITYDRKTLEAMAPAKHAVSHRAAKTTRTQTAAATPTPRPRPTPSPRPTPRPPPVGLGPFWQYAVFGGSIGAGNIIIGPVPPGGGAPEILFNSYSYGGFWQSIRFNPSTGNYDQVFVSPIYTPRNGDPFVAINRIGLARVTNASDQQIVVMLEDGRIYLYDFATKAQVGYLDVGPFPFYSGLKALSLTDLDGDGFAELIATTENDLYVFNGSGQLLWQVPGAGGYDVVAGRMDNGASLKIATTSGEVVDATTHAIVWDYTNGFGFRLKLAPFPGENYQQLIAEEDWDFVYSYDVGRQLPRWSISTFDNDALAIADVDNDGVPEVIVGDGQWGSVHVYDLNTQSEKWVSPTLPSAT